MERITASQVREGDKIQHSRRQWPAQTVTKVSDRYGYLTFDLSGGSRVSGVAPSAAFLRYSDGETGRDATFAEVAREQMAIAEALDAMEARS
jgi:hypothetical protein